MAYIGLFDDVISDDMGVGTARGGHRERKKGKKVCCGCFHIIRIIIFTYNTSTLFLQHSVYHRYLLASYQALLYRLMIHTSASN